MRYNYLHRINTEVLCLERFLYFIVNKKSKKSIATYNHLLIELPKYTNNYQLVVTENLEQLDQLLAEIKTNIQKNDLIIVVGGDGSLNQFVTLYKKHKLSNSIGYIPAGSGNDFARAHRIPTNTEKAVQSLFSVNEKQYLAIICARENSTDHYAVNSFGAGIDGQIINLVNSNKLKKKRSFAPYISAIFSAFSRQNKFPLTLQVDDKVYEFKNVQLALIANNSYLGGGINLIPEADGSDDELDVLIADNVSFKDLIFIVSRIFTDKKHLSHPKLHSFKSKEVMLAIDSDQYAQKDGELIHQNEYNYHFNTEMLPFWI